MSDFENDTGRGLLNDEKSKEGVDPETLPRDGL